MVTNIKFRRSGISLIEVLVVIGIIGILISLLIPAVQKIRAAAARASCQNNLRQMGLAMMMFHNAKDHFPPGSASFDSKTEELPFLSYLPHLLPYLEQESLYNQAVKACLLSRYDPNNDPPHIGNLVIKMFGCPADNRVSEPTLFPSPLYSHESLVKQYGLTSYLGIVGLATYLTSSSETGVLYNYSKVRILDITDGTSNTAMVGERPPFINPEITPPYGKWYAGTYVNPLLGVRNRCESWIQKCPFICEQNAQHFKDGKLDNFCDAFHFWSLHSGGANFLFADGSVHFLPYAADLIMPALATRAGGETISGEFY